MSRLWPREHGAYAQLGFPLATGLVLSGGHPGAFAFTAVAVALFLAHEPLAVLMGTRGARLQKALERPARWRLGILSAVAAVGVAGAALLAPTEAWVAALAPAVPGLALVPLFFMNRVKTLPGEVVAAAAFSASVLPVAMSGSVSWAYAWLAAGVWFAATLPAILSVHAVKAAHKGQTRGRWLVPATLALAGLVMVVSILAAATLPEPADRALAVVPSAVAVLGFGLARPHPRHLMRIGWTMVGANTLTLVLLLVL